MSFELTLIILEGGISAPVSNTRSYYVETSVAGAVKREDTTDVVKIVHGAVKWNKTIVKTFDCLDSEPPIVISLSMYQTNLLQPGYSLVGTGQVALADVFRIVDKPAVVGKLELQRMKHTVRTSFIVVQLQVRKINSNSVNTSPALTMNRLDKRAISIDTLPVLKGPHTYVYEADGCDTFTAPKDKTKPNNTYYQELLAPQGCKDWNLQASLFAIILVGVVSFIIIIIVYSRNPWK